MVTIKDISQAAGVSTASVSKVLNGDYSGVGAATRERILTTARELKYRPNRIARGLVKKQTDIIGLLVPDVSNPYYADLSKGAEEETEKRNINLILCNALDSSEKEFKYVNMLLEYNVDGVILSSMTSYNSKSQQLLDDYGIPYVAIDRTGMSAPISFFTNGQRGTFISTEYLIRIGHWKLGFIGGEGGQQLPGENLRLMGFRNALQAQGIPFEPDRVRYGSYTMETGYLGAQSLLQSKQEITAFVCANDLVAFGAIKAIREVGLHVPGDISVVGYDDIVLSSFFEPKLTTVRQDSYTLGKNACIELMELISGNRQDQILRYVEPELIVRESTCPR